jgi:6-pyruvoyl-tetrahydropterin synthase
VRDFAEIKEKISQYINEHVDHGMILNIKDYEWIDIMVKMGQKIHVMGKNPTAENMAEHFYDVFKADFPELCCVKIQETPNAIASYEG